MNDNLFVRFRRFIVRYLNYKISKYLVKWIPISVYPTNPIWLNKRYPVQCPEKCIYHEWRCDGEDDCEGAADEIDCGYYTFLLLHYMNTTRYHFLCRHLLQSITLANQSSISKHPGDKNKIQHELRYIIFRVPFEYNPPLQSNYRNNLYGPAWICSCRWKRFTVGQLFV